MYISIYIVTNCTCFIKTKRAEVDTGVCIFVDVGTRPKNRGEKIDSAKEW